MKAMTEERAIRNNATRLAMLLGFAAGTALHSWTWVVALVGVYLIVLGVDIIRVVDAESDCG